ncbi:MAG: hypothetical protein AAGU27_23370 [Dehalobacterium sp.]
MNAYQKMVVIFVDLLGTKNNEKFEDKFLIHRLFHGEAKINEERNLKHVIYERKVYSFSDCAYFLYYYKEGIDESCKDDMKLLQIAMYNTSLSLLRIFNAGYLVRGGITIGDAYFDELGFFGPAVEDAYKLESAYADVPMIALSPLLGKSFYAWEESQTNMEIVNLMMTSRPMLVEKENDKYFLNIFYQLETFTSSLSLESGSVNIDDIKQFLFKIISRDKERYKDNHESCKENRATIYEKLVWMEKYLNSKHNRMNSDLFSGRFSVIVSDD